MREISLLRRSFARRAISNLAWKVYCWSENLNNVSKERNGEFFFLSCFEKEDTFTFFDVGANVGDYSEAILRRSPNAYFHLFEPASECISCLNERFTGRGNFFINKVAVSNSSGKAKLWFNEPGSTLGSLYERDLKEYDLYLDQYAEVDKIRLDNYIRKQSIDHIDLMKIDVEGHELEVLEGMGEFLRGDYIDYIQFEYGGCNLDSGTLLRSLYTLLENNSFIVCKMMPGGLLPMSYSSSMENFQYSNYVAIGARVWMKCENVFSSNFDLK